MNKLSETFKKVTDKFKELSKGRKIAFVLLLASIIVVIIYLGIILNTTKYGVLFSEMDSSDSGAIIKKLDDSKVTYKIDGNSILVPSEQVDSLRMKMYSEVQFTGGSPGWELFESSGMVATDFDNKVKYQRALQGQLEKMIESFDEIKDCIVNLSLSTETVFVRDVEPAQAAVAIKLNPGVKKLNNNQVKAIVALLTGGVKNLPKENVQVAVDGMILATDGLFEEEENGMISSNKQSELKKQYEEELKNKILNILEPIYKNGIRVAVTADMNFDAKQTESIDYKEGVKVSEKEIISTSSNKEGDNSSSPIDNNFTTSIDESNSNNTNTSHSEVTRNYQVPEVKEIHIESPGKVEKINVSVTVDESRGILDEKTKSKIRNSVATAIGFNIDRGDFISVEGFVYNLQNQDLMAGTINVLKDAEKVAEKQKLERQVAYGFGAALILFLIMITMKRLGKSKEDDFEGIDVMIGDNIENKPEQFEPINFDNEDEQSHIAKEVKKYAKDKPEQVVDIIKAWLTEDEG